VQILIMVYVWGVMIREIPSMFGSYKIIF
jgi:hypothetical protein